MRERYADFGPTLASEHLASDEGLRIHAESLRRWMREAGLWRRQRKRKPYRQRRERKAHLGELVQLDGSFHDWLEERGGEACLMHMIDDATHTVHAQFSAQETIWAARSTGCAAGSKGTVFRARCIRTGRTCTCAWRPPGSSAQVRCP